MSSSLGVNFSNHTTKNFWSRYHQLFQETNELQEKKSAHVHVLFLYSEWNHFPWDKAVLACLELRTTTESWVVLRKLIYLEDLEAKELTLGRILCWKNKRIHVTGCPDEFSVILVSLSTRATAIQKTIGLNYFGFEWDSMRCREYLVKRIFVRIHWISGNLVVQNTFFFRISQVDKYTFKVHTLSLIHNQNVVASCIWFSLGAVRKVSAMETIEYCNQFLVSGNFSIPSWFESVESLMLIFHSLLDPITAHSFSFNKKFTEIWGDQDRDFSQWL